MTEEMECSPLYGRLLIDEKLRQFGASIADLANKVGTDKTQFYRKLKDPNLLTLREARAISAALGLTAEQIYNTFIMFYGWERKYVEKGYGKTAGRKTSRSAGSSAEDQEGEE